MYGLCFLCNGREKHVRPGKRNQTKHLSWKQVHIQRRIKPIALFRLSTFFRTSAQCWMGLQNDFDTEEQQTAQ
ncbi:hypothetical protein CYPRO_2618 [Cyclonatronum proteinivorum]|uniref:Addiction module antidote protein, HigA family n=1 Tax=Cyclonatronum proteinivorum TaxID=1457365 RepID=A0A345UN08_9BACT|nr:hypothetical protein CYPRO_2618 [Cyclonatronum proteinivorum]